MMKKKKAKNGWLTMAPPVTSTAAIESLVSVDERGQMVLPKEIRDRAEIRPGDKLAVVCWEKDGDGCCISLIKTDYLTGLVKDFLGPVMKDVLK